jgi:aminopeptidase N
MHSTSIESKAHLIEEYAPPLWNTPEISIRFDLDIERTVVRTEYKIRYNSHQDTQDFPELFLNGVGLRFLSIRIDGVICEPSTYTITEEGLHLKNPPGPEFLLLIENSISPKSNTALEGLYHSGSMLCTQNEPEGFRKIIYSVDRPDNLTIFTVTLSGDKALFPVLFSNGNLISTRALDGGKHEAVWHDPYPKPSYLFAIVAGELSEVSDTYTTLAGKKVDLKIFVDAKNKDKTEFAMLALKEAMLWDEQTFGLAYDLDLYMIVAVDDFNMGAMENKGLNLFNSKLVLADKKSATDETFESILGVVAHEYFHNWTGNRVTLRNWFNLTLKEGLTVFRDQWFTEDKTDASVKRIKDVLFLMEHQFQEDAGPMSHPILPKSYVEMNNFYTVTVYEKGAEVIRMLSLLLGRETFKKGLKHYLTKYDGTGVTYEEFLSSMEEVSGKSLTHFRNWYHRSGTPKIQVWEEWDETSFEYKLNFVDLENGALTLCYPMSLALFSSDGKLISEEILEINEKSFTKTWKNFRTKPIVSLLRGFSAPVKIQFDRAQNDYAFLATYEKEGVARFFALQEVILRELKVSFINNLPVDTQSIFSIFDEMLNQQNSLPKDYLSYLLTIPSLTQLSEVFECFDFELIENARKSFISLVANTYTSKLQEMYAENYKAIPNQSRDAIGKRRLKNLALFYLFQSDVMKDRIADMAILQQTEAKHMSEELAVLRLFCESGMKGKEKSVDFFFRKWQKEPLVLDYWFSARVSYGEDALLVANSLLKLPEFQWENPNRVRALVGAFARNPRSFHKKDGSGYLFLANALEKLNQINPQIASNLGKLFQSVRLQSEDRRHIAKGELDRLLKLKGLSSDLEEVLSKIWKGL